MGDVSRPVLEHQRKRIRVIGVVGHVSRLPMAQQLAGKVCAQYVSIDDGTLGCSGNHLKVWATLAERNPDAEWLCVLEDDAIPCTNFRHQLNQALAVAPTPIVSLYLGTGFPTQWQRFIRAAVAKADTDNATWIASTDLLHAVGYAIHTNLIPDMLTHTNATLPIDQAISAWARRNKHQVAYTWPSLVDHHDGQPAITHRHDGRPRNKPRKAWRHGTHEHWTANITQLR